MAIVPTETGEDYSAYVDKTEGPAVDLSQLQDLAEQQLAAEAKVASIEAELNTAREKLKDIAEKRLPEMMDQVGLEDFRTRSGIQIKIAENIRASIPKARADEAFSWLIKNNHEALIKREVAVQFGKGESEHAKVLAGNLVKLGFSPEMSATVHSQTLSAWVRKKLEEGAEIPLDLFGVFRQRVSKVAT